MAKRKKTATVQLKLRIREELRRKLEREKDLREVSLNSEMVRRLENSFESGTTDFLMRALTGSRANSELLAIIAQALLIAERSLHNNPERRRITGDAVKKIIEAYFSGEQLRDELFPEREKSKSADDIAHLSFFLRGRLVLPDEQAGVRSSPAVTPGHSRLSGE